MVLLGFWGDLPFLGWSVILPRGRDRPKAEGSAGVGLVLEALGVQISPGHSGSPDTVLLACVAGAS